MNSVPKQPTASQLADMDRRWQAAMDDIRETRKQWEYALDRSIRLRHSYLDAFGIDPNSRLVTNAAPAAVDQPVADQTAVGCSHGKLPGWWCQDCKRVV
jgi:hypothetical protein